MFSFLLQLIITDINGFVKLHHTYILISYNSYLQFFPSLLLLYLNFKLSISRVYSLPLYCILNICCWQRKALLGKCVSMSYNVSFKMDFSNPAGLFFLKGWFGDELGVEARIDSAVDISWWPDDPGIIGDIDRIFTEFPGRDTEFLFECSGEVSGGGKLETIGQWSDGNGTFFHYPCGMKEALPDDILLRGNIEIFLKKPVDTGGWQAAVKR